MPGTPCSSSAHIDEQLFLAGIAEVARLGGGHPYRYACRIGLGFHPHKIVFLLLQGKVVGCTVENIAIGGATTYKMQPDWYTPPANRSGFPVDKTRNIDKAISLNPDGIIINYPSNDAANNFTLQEQKDNFLRVKAKADSAGIPIWVTTTQPRNFANASHSCH